MINKKNLIAKINQENREVFVFKGVSEKQIDELHQFAKNDDLVKYNTSDLTRFENRANFPTWQEEKTIYTLSDETQSYLGGIIWLEKKELPARSNLPKEDYELTIAIRIYGSLRGHGLALPFAKAVLKDFLKSNQIQGIWLETSFDNLPTQKTFAKLGFVKVAEKDDRGKIVMVCLIDNLQKTL